MTRNSPPSGVGLIISNLIPLGLYYDQNPKVVISDPSDVLRKHLPEFRQLSYNLRPRPHGFIHIPF